MKCPKCGWQNSPGNKKCINCGVLLETAEIPTYPHRSKRRAKGFGGTKREAPLAFKKGLNAFSRFLITSGKVLLRLLSLYGKILSITLFGLIPSIIQFAQKRRRPAFFFLFMFLCFTLFFAISIRSPFSNFCFFSLLFISLLSSIDAVIHYYRKKKYKLKAIPVIGIVLTSISMMFLLYAVFTGIMQYSFLRITILRDDFEPFFLQGDRVLVYTNAFVNKMPERGDIVAARYGSRPTIERIVGIPGETIDIQGGKIIIDESPLEGKYYPLRKMPDVTATTTLSRDSYFLMVYRQHNVPRRIELLTINRNHIVGKAILIFSPPERRGFIE